MSANPEIGTTETKIHNLVLIRYNMCPPVKWRQGRPKNLDQDWLETRNDLFSRFCLPSLGDQSDADPIVLLFLDMRTPRSLVDSLCAESFIRPVMTVSEIDTGTEMLAEVTRGVNKLVEEMRHDGLITEGDVVATTRLDSDDALAPGHLARANTAYRTAGSPEELYAFFPLGQQYIEGSGEYRLRRYPRNAFGTLFECYRGQRLRTVMHCKHNELLDAHRTVAVAEGEPQWCMVIHDSNVSNRARGQSAESGFFPVGAGRALRSSGGGG